MNFYIFRHGETFETKNNIPYGKRVYSAEILPEGIPAIKRLANYLKDIKTDKNFSSPFIRCKQTTGIVSGVTGKEYVFDDRLGEYVEIKESFDQMAKRIKEFLDERRNYKGSEPSKVRNLKSVSICTHGTIIAGLIYFISTGNYYEHQLLDFPKPGILVEIKNMKVKYIDFNDILPAS